MDTYIQWPAYGDAHWLAPVPTATDLPAQGFPGDVIVAKDTGVIYVWVGGMWQTETGVSGVTSLNGLMGTLTITGAGGITVTPSGSTIALSTTGLQTTLTFADSLLNTAGTVTLKGDSASPGASEYYGTDGSSVLGYHALPLSSPWQQPGGIGTPIEQVDSTAHVEFAQPIIDTSGVVSVDPNNRRLYDTNGTTDTLQWGLNTGGVIAGGVYLNADSSIGAGAQAPYYNGAIAIGPTDVNAYGYESIAIGSVVSVYGNFGVCIGSNLSSNFGVCIGSNLSSAGPGSVNIGDANNSYSFYDICIGYSLSASGAYSTLVGSNLTDNGNAYTTALGYNNSVGAVGISIGVNNTSTGEYSALLGWGLSDGGYSFATVIGDGITAPASSTLTLGGYGISGGEIWMTLGHGTVSLPNVTTSTGSAAGTLSNAPTAGNPAGYLQVTINGTLSYLPYWQ